MVTRSASPSNPGPTDAFQLEEATVGELRARMDTGALTSEALVRAYLERIAAIDRHGPRLNSIIELNPDALKIAAALDAERAHSGLRGPLHGIPVLLKDNISTGDRMLTTAGSLALAKAPATRDAHIVSKLRAAGAVILGKTNLSEWANIRSTRPTSGWSGRGGLTRNPYALDRNTSGSSSGSAAAIAANLAVLAVGTETDGSIVSPASVNGLVGIKPTVGLVSRDGIIPISHSQDTAGPMARTVTDAALLLATLAGFDRNDPASVAKQADDYLAALTSTRLQGARIGVVRGSFGENERVATIIEGALKVLIAQGAELVDPVVIPNVDKYADAELDVLLFEFKDGLNRYLPEFAPHAPVQSLADVIAWNNANAAAEMPYFGQELFERAQAKGDLLSPNYLAALANIERYARVEGLAALFDELALDALVAPTGGPGWTTDLINGDHSGNGFSSPAAVAGYPHITVPAGALLGMPIGLSFVGPPFSEARLIGYAFCFEQASRARTIPRYPGSAPMQDQT